MRAYVSGIFFAILCGASGTFAADGSAAPSIDALLGGYTNRSHDDLEIFREDRKTAPGPFGISVTTTDGSCAGTASGPLRHDKKGYFLADTKFQCRIDLALHGNVLQVTETRECSNLHGSGCAFEGKYTREGQKTP